MRESEGKSRERHHTLKEVVTPNTDNYAPGKGEINLWEQSRTGKCGNKSSFECELKANNGSSLPPRVTKC